MSDFVDVLGMAIEATGDKKRKQDAAPTECWVLTFTKTSSDPNNESQVVRVYNNRQRAHADLGLCFADGFVYTVHGPIPFYS